MRIAIFTETYLPDINGVVTHIKILRDGLIKQGHEVLIVTADADAQHHFIKDGILHCPGVHAKKIYNYSLSYPISIKRVNLIRRFAPDIIHIHNEFGVGMSGAVIAKLLHIPFVYTLHTMYDDYIYYVAKKAVAPVIKNASHAYFRILAKSATAVTGPSRKVEEYFRNQCGVDRDVYVIPNPVELDKFVPKGENSQQTAALRSSLGIPDDAVLCCFCGRLGKEKSVDVLLKFWSEECIRDKKLYLLIFGDGPVKPELEALSEALGVSENVVFTGRVEHEQLPLYLQLCRIYITASLSDTYSISMLEGMAAGLPVLTLRDPENEGQIIDGVNGYVFSNAKEMYSFILKINGMSDEEYNAFSSRVIKKASENSADSLANALMDIYNDAIEKYSTKPSKYRKLKARLRKL